MLAKNQANLEEPHCCCKPCKLTTVAINIVSAYATISCISIFILYASVNKDPVQKLKDPLTIFSGIFASSEMIICLITVRGIKKVQAWLLLPFMVWNTLAGIIWLLLNIFFSQNAEKGITVDSVYASVLVIHFGSIYIIGRTYQYFKLLQGSTGDKKEYQDIS